MFQGSRSTLRMHSVMKTGTEWSAKSLSYFAFQVGHWCKKGLTSNSPFLNRFPSVFLYYLLTFQHFVGHHLTRCLTGVLFVFDVWCFQTFGLWYWQSRKVWEEKVAGYRQWPRLGGLPQRMTHLELFPNFACPWELVHVERVLEPQHIRVAGMLWRECRGS